MKSSLSPCYLAPILVLLGILQYITSDTELKQVLFALILQIFGEKYPMGRVTNYRAKIIGLIEKEALRFNDFYEEEDAPHGKLEFIGTIEDQVDHEVKIDKLEEVLRLLDALESVGVYEGPGFCNKISEATGYSRNRVSDMLSGNAWLNSRFVKAVSKSFGTSEAFILEGKGMMATEALNTGKEPGMDIAIKEAVSVLESMTEADRWRAVAALKEMKANLGKAS